MPTPFRAIAVLVLTLLLGGCASAPPHENEYNLGVQSYKLKDYSGARQHWSKAVAEGEIMALNNLGYLLYSGLGGERDEVAAVTLWMRAAVAHNAESQWHMGQAHEAGKGTTQSDIEAYAWYRCAASSLDGQPDADEVDVEIVRDASTSLARLLPRLSPQQFKQSEVLAKDYIAKYAKRAPEKT